MLFLYGELMVLLVVFFGIGSALGAVVTRALVKEMPAEISGVPGPVGDGALVEGGGTP